MFCQYNIHLDLTAVHSGCTNGFVRFMARLGTQRVEMRALSLTGCVAQLALSPAFCNVSCRRILLQAIV